MKLIKTNFFTQVLMSFLTALVFIHQCIFSVERVKYTDEGLIEEGFVTLATSNYFPLLEILLDSVAEFSTRPIVVVGVNADVPFSTEKYPFMIKKRYNLKGPINALNTIRVKTYFAKAEVILDSGLQHGIYLDADTILNETCDELFENCQRHMTYPLCPLHRVGDRFEEDALREVMGVTETTMPAIHAPIIIFSEQCKPFINEWHSCNVLYGHLAKHYDEGVLSVLLWKYKINDYLRICDPIYHLAEDYLNGGTEMHENYGYRNWIGKIDFHTFHGCKEPEKAREILKGLIEKKQIRAAE